MKNMSGQPYTYGFDAGRKLEIDLIRRINEVSGRDKDAVDQTFLLNEDMLRDKFGYCKNNEGKNIVGVDCLCFINGVIYAIQCKQYSNNVPTKYVHDFICYTNYLEKKIGLPIKKIWSSSTKSWSPGNKLGDENGVVWIIYPNTKSLIINTVNYLFTGKFLVDDDGDIEM